MVPAELAKALPLPRFHYGGAVATSLIRADGAFPVSSEPNKNLMRRVERAAEVLLDREGRFTYPSLLQELGMLAPRDLEAWRGGLVPFLEKVVRANLTKLARIQTAVRRLARGRNLERLVARAPRGRRYSKTGHPFVEEEYGVTYRVRHPKAERPGPRFLTEV